MTREYPEPSPGDERLPATDLRPQPELSTAPVDTPRLAAGAVVVHFDPSPSGADSFCHATATGPEIIDPRTNDWWAPVILRDGAIDLLPAALIVNVVPDPAAGDKT